MGTLPIQRTLPCPLKQNTPNVHCSMPTWGSPCGYQLLRSAHADSGAMGPEATWVMPSVVTLKFIFLQTKPNQLTPELSPFSPSFLWGWGAR